VTLGFANCTTHRLWHEPLPPSIEWLRCPTCAHVHTRDFWTQAGRDEVRRTRGVPTASELAAAVAAGRSAWKPIVEKVCALLGGYAMVSKDAGRPLWVDVGTGDGSLPMMAADYGFAAIGLDDDAGTIGQLQQLGFSALNADFTTLRFEVTPRVLSMMGFLQQVAQPREALQKAAQVLADDGMLVIGLPDMSASGWKLLEATAANPFWTQLEHHHNFGRERLIALLRECDFDVVDLTISQRHESHIELYAVRRTRTP
jgi:SAM-dependent methyltransferase